MDSPDAKYSMKYEPKNLIEEDSEQVKNKLDSYVNQGRVRK